MVKKTNKKSKAAIGAYVLYGGHDGYFVADIFHIEDVCIIRAGRPVTMNNLIRDESFGPATHHMVDFPGPNFWCPDRGVFVVPEDQLTILPYGKAKSRKP